MSREYHRNLLIVLTALGAAFAVICAPITTMTAMFSFDAPGSENELFVWVIFFIVLSIPLWFVVGPIAGWIFFQHGQRRASLLAAITPIIMAAGLVGLAWLYA
jgi:hypothetical protein